MDDRAPAPQPPVFNLNAYSPAEIKEAVEKVGVKKAGLPILASFMLAIVAGGSIGFGACDQGFAEIVLANQLNPFPLHHKSTSNDWFVRPENIP